MEQLIYAHATELYAALMVPKVQPPDDTRPLMKVARYFAYTPCGGALLWQQSYEVCWCTASTATYVGLAALLWQQSCEVGEGKFVKVATDFSMMRMT